MQGSLTEFQKYALWLKNSPQDTKKGDNEQDGKETYAVNSWTC
jgi:hypothetical protein